MDVLTKILTAAIDLFRQYGFKAVTMDDIARRAGISKKTLYQHFANKNEVVSESVVWFKTRICDSCDHEMKESANAVEAMVRTQTIMDQVHKQTNPMILFELQKYFPEAFQLFRDQLIEKDMEIIKQTILQGMEEGNYRSDINAELMARYRLETSLIMFQPNLLVTERYDLMFVAHEICEHFMYGIMTAKGEKLYQKYKQDYLKQVSKI